VPTYEYRCKKCRYEFSREQSIRDKPLVRCPKCRGRLEKLLPQTLNLIFKGSGFYVTDYKKQDTAAGPSKSVTKRARDGSKSKPVEKTGSD
jgi:putative FmdB family regulatory protein